jgi:hypothetical protein
MEKLFSQYANHIIDWHIENVKVKTSVNFPYEIYREGGGLVCFSKTGSNDWLKTFLISNLNCLRAKQTVNNFIPVDKLFFHSIRGVGK